MYVSTWVYHGATYRGRPPLVPCSDLRGSWLVALISPIKFYFYVLADISSHLFVFIERWDVTRYECLASLVGPSGLPLLPPLFTRAGERIATIKSTIQWSLSPGSLLPIAASLWRPTWPLHQPLLDRLTNLRWSNFDSRWSKIDLSYRHIRSVQVLSDACPAHHLHGSRGRSHESRTARREGGVVVGAGTEIVWSEQGLLVPSSTSPPVLPPFVSLVVTPVAPLLPLLAIPGQHQCDTRLDPRQLLPVVSVPVVVTMSSHPGRRAPLWNCGKESWGRPPAAASSSPAFSSAWRRTRAHCRAKLQTAPGGSKDDLVTGRQQ